MLQPRGRGLSLADWLVLCLISEGPTHGFAIAGLLTLDSSLVRSGTCTRQRSTAPRTG
jgi:hypothetical protein